MKYFYRLQLLYFLSLYDDTKFDCDHTSPLRTKEAEERTVSSLNHTSTPRTSYVVSAKITILHALRWLKVAWYEKISAAILRSSVNQLGEFCSNMLEMPGSGLQAGEMKATEIQSPLSESVEKADVNADQLRIMVNLGSKIGLVEVIYDEGHIDIFNLHHDSNWEDRILLMKSSEEEDGVNLGAVINE
jgi:hypothetical protein